MSSHVDSLLLLGRPAHVVTIGLQREQHGQRRHMGVVVAAGVAAVVMIVVIMMMVMAAPAMTAVAFVSWLAFVQLKRLAHTNVVFAHV
ncbi:MAG TPA: hypothetical protein VGH23_15285 [Rhizomicrobium sp.]|jgi:hypothetical protein